MCNKLSFKKAVAKLIELRDNVDRGKLVCSTTVRHYADRVDRCGDNDYTFKVGTSNGQPLDTKCGSPFRLAPEDLDAKWVIKEL